MTDTARRVRLLGPAAVNTGVDEPLSPRLRRLLAALALSRGMQVSESALIDIVWAAGGDLPQNPARSLQTYVSRLRRLLGAEAIERKGAGYRLVPDLIWLDITEFERLLDHSRNARAEADDRRAVDSLERALSLWSGGALSDFSGESWAMAEAHRLEELRIDAQEQRADILIGLEDVDGALIADLERLAGSHPHRDGPTRHLMRALHKAGRQADALGAFSRHRRQLSTDLGLGPSAELALLESQILTDDPSLAAAARSRPFRGYEMIERLGEGAFSIVYRGSQPSLGREVAIKQIRAELVNRPEFIRRFDTEAHLVARLEHPHIVPLYDYWREPGSAYLVMRLLRAGSLESAMRSGPWELDRAMQMVGHIGGALAEAHRAGIVHRDVKPANILLDGSGNAYLTDFGIALEVHELAEPSPAMSAGTPAYAAPEQLLREAVGPAADIYGMGVVLHETLTGRLPLRTSTGSDLPPDLDRVITRAISNRPADRHSSIEEFVDDVQRAVQGRVPDEIRFGAVEAVREVERNPYKGLRAFDEADAVDFAGRTRLVDRLVSRLRHRRFLAVVGPSGSGKSSVVKAGLLPALRAGAIRGSDEWFITSMLPGPAPFEELETALLRVAAERPTDLLAVLRSGDRGIARALRHAVPAEGGQVLLVIDQFEELFSLADPAVARSFLDALSVAVSEEHPRVRVVTTLRADFHDRLLRHEAIARLMHESTEAVPPLAPDELERAIVDPADAVGVRFEPGLVSRIVADVADRPGSLPLLQYALTELYDRQQSGLLTQSTYSDLGGVAGALSDRAEGLYGESTVAQQIAIRRIFSRLVKVGEGSEDSRRRAARSELGGGADVGSALELLGDARLLTFNRDPISREPTVEVAHEALIREWPRLRRWIDEDRDGLPIMHHLHATATEWNRRGWPPGELYRGERLDAAEQWAGAHDAELMPTEADFIASSVHARDEHEEITRRTTLRLRRRLLSAAAVAVLALAAGAVALRQQSARDRAAAAGLVEAEGQAFESETGRLISRAIDMAAGNPRVGMLLALAAHQREPSPATLGALHQTLIGSGAVVQQLRWGTSYLDVDWVAGERLIATRSDGLDLIDLGTGESIDSIALTGASRIIPTSKRTSVDSTGSLVAVLSDRSDGEPAAAVPSELSIYSVSDRFDLRARIALGRIGANVSVSPSGDIIVTGAITPNESVVTAWSPDGEILWATSRTRLPGGVATVIVSVTNDEVFISEGGELRRLSHSGELLGTATVITGPGSGVVVDMVDTDDGWRAYGYGGTTAEVDRVGGFPESLKFVRTPGGTVPMLPGGIIGIGTPQALSLSPGKERVAVAHSLGVTVAALDGRTPLAGAVPRDHGHDGLSVSSDGSRIVLYSRDAAQALRPEVWELVRNGWVIDPADPADSPGWEATVPPGSRDTIYARTGGEDSTPLSPHGPLRAIMPVGGRLVSVYETGRWDEPLRVLEGPTPSDSVLSVPYVSVRFDPRGERLLLAGNDGAVRIWDVASWMPIDPDFFAGQDITVAAWSDDGSFVATSASDGSISIRDGDSFEVITVMSGARPVRMVGWMAFSPDASLLLSVLGGQALLWDVVSGERIGVDMATGPASVLPALNEDRDGLRLVTGTDSHALSWNLDPDTWAEIACRTAGSNLSAEEWSQWGPRDTARYAICPDHPLPE